MRKLYGPRLEVEPHCSILFDDNPRLLPHSPNILQLCHQVRRARLLRLDHEVSINLLYHQESVTIDLVKLLLDLDLVVDVLHRERVDVRQEAILGWVRHFEIAWEMVSCSVYSVVV